MPEQQLDTRSDALDEDDGSALGKLVKTVAALAGLALVVYLIAKVVRD